MSSEGIARQEPAAVPRSLPVAAAVDALLSSLLPFQRSALSELLSQDSLCVLAPGLGLPTLAAALAVHAQAAHASHGARAGCMAILGSSPAQRDAVQRELRRFRELALEEMHDPKGRFEQEKDCTASEESTTLAPLEPIVSLHPLLAAPIPDITAEHSPQERERLYATCPVVFLTTRLAVVDLLSERLGPSLAGVTLLSAHRALEESGEAFAAQLARERGGIRGTQFVSPLLLRAPGEGDVDRCQPGSGPDPSDLPGPPRAPACDIAPTRPRIRALTDVPWALAARFSAVERVLKVLRIQKLHLWPRFQAQVKLDLGDGGAVGGEEEEVQEEVVDLTEGSGSGADAGSMPSAGGGSGSLPEPSDALPDALPTFPRPASSPPRPASSPPRPANSPLPQSPPLAIVEELSQSMTGAMGIMYDAIARLMEACIAELRSGNALDGSDLSVDRGLFRSFDEAVKRQLSRTWHLVSPKTKQLVSDVRTLRTLCGYLLRFDPVTFLTYLETLRATEGSKSVWLFHSAAHTIFGAAKSRVFALKARGPSKKRGGRGAEGADAGEDDGVAGDGTGRTRHALEVRLEEMPKWALLRELVREFREQGVSLADVAVVCQDAFTASQLERVLARGSRAVLEGLWRGYLARRLAAGRGGGAHGVAVGGQDEEEGPGGLHAEEAAILAAARAQENAAARAQENAAGSASAKPARKRARAGEGAKVRTSERPVHVLSQHAESLARETVRRVMEGGEEEEEAERSGRVEAENDVDNENFQGSRTAASEDAPLFLVLDHASSLMLLWERQPSHVVVFDPDVTLTRQLELLAAFYRQRSLPPPHVFLLRYDDSFEMDRFQAGVERERAAFVSLIRAKAHLARDAAADRGADERLLRARGAGVARAAQQARLREVLAALTDPAGPSSRRAGGRSILAPADPHFLPSAAETGSKSSRLAQNALKSRVVADVREFRSALPGVLHAHGLELVPLTLEVGDYVLSPDLVVERKALADLKSSLLSGRLRAQAAAMSEHYATPVLLIEFAADSAFVFQGAPEFADDARSGGGGGASVAARLVLLVLQFPRLRLLWSRSPRATAELFALLKAVREEPDPVKAALVGLPDAAEGAVLYNAAALDLLRQVPGLAEANVRALARAGGSLRGLARMSELDMARAVQSTTVAKKVRRFLDADCVSVLARA